MPTERTTAELGLIESMLKRPAEVQSAQGYRHTLKEIAQQPDTWRTTARQAAAERSLFRKALDGVRSIALTGSGSSEYAGACVHLGLRRALHLPVESAPAGLILTHGRDALPSVRPGLLVSLARSGDSPESCAAVEYCLRAEPDLRHLIITCNAEGRLAREHASHPRVNVLVLDPRTNDRSLAMTSSFTNMALAAGFLGMTDGQERFLEVADGLAAAGEKVLTQDAASVAKFTARGFRKAMFLGSGPAFGAAREGALKMLELTAGRVATMAETPLGLRHGPMSWVDSDTVVIGFLSSDPIVRAYECDLIEELDRKEIGTRRVLVADRIPGGLRTSETLAIEWPGMAQAGETFAPIGYVLAAQLIAFFRCLEEGLKPDAPSENGVISRVVGSFRIHTRAGEK